MIKRYALKTLPLILLLFSQIQVTAQEDNTDCLCEFGIRYMTVRYDGPSGVAISVYASRNQSDFVQSFENVDSGTELFIDKSAFMKGSVKTKTYLAVQDLPGSEVYFHTSCSEYILNQTKGFFTVTAYEDAFGHSCSFSSALSVEGVVTSNACSDGQEGSIFLTVSGGLAPYKYQWQDGNTSAGRDGLVSGTYYVVVTDASGISDSAIFLVESPDPLFLESEIVYTSCGTDPGAEINLIFGGGTPSYKANWSTGDTTSAISGLNEGTYTVMITDANECTISDTFDIAETLPLTVSITEDACLTGILTAEVTGGMGPFSYSWSDGSNTVATQAENAGTYSVTLSDSQGCTAGDTIVVDSLANLTTTASFEQPDCTGGLGSIFVEVTGNMSPFSFYWSTGDTTQNLEEVTSGDYTLFVTDQRGESCAEPFEFTLRDAPETSLIATVYQITCAGSADGRIEIDSIIGKGPFTIIWEDGDTTMVLEGLTPGGYQVTVTDSFGCMIIESFQIDEPEVLQVSIDHNFCNRRDLRALVSGGTSPYSFTWNGQPGNASLVPDSAGTYQVVVTDANGCMDSAEIAIGEPHEPLNISGTASPATCESSGEIDLQVTGGTGPYIYFWSTGDTIPDLTGLSAGYYQVMVSDQGNCSKTRLFDVRDLTGLTVSTVLNQPGCNEDNGSITVSPLGGLPPYAFAWSTGDTTSNIAGLSSGNFEVTVSDAGGCQHIESITLARPDTCSVSSGDSLVCCDGKVTWLSLKYLGTTATTVQVYQKIAGFLVFDAQVSPGEVFTFHGMDRKNTLGPEIIVKTGTGETTQIHTSCSQPIGPGLIRGSFEVVAGESRNGGALCPVSSQAQNVTTYSVYPNPSDNGQMNLVLEESSDPFESVEVKIYDLTGAVRSHETYEGGSDVLDVSLQILFIPKGQYILQIFHGGQTNTQRILIR